MGKVVNCDECHKVYRDLEALEDLRENDSICLVCNGPIEVEDWDRVLASFEEDDFDDVTEDVDEDDFSEDLEEAVEDFAQLDEFDEAELDGEDDDEAELGGEDDDEAELGGEDDDEDLGEDLDENPE